MLAVGVILVLVAASALVVALVAGTDETVRFELALVEGEISATAVFLLGAATVLLFVMGLELIRSGTRRANRRRKERRELSRLARADDGTGAGPDRAEDGPRPATPSEPPR